MMASGDCHVMGTFRLGVVWPAESDPGPADITAVRSFEVWRVLLASRFWGQKTGIVENSS